MFRPEVLASNIKKYRIRKGITQPELAEQLFVSSQAISKWECAQSVPDLPNLWKLSNFLEVSVDKLLGNYPYSDGSKCLIGIDGGATKTEFALFTEEGRIIERVLLEGCNPNVCGLERTCAILKKGVDTLLNVCSDVSGLFAGMAGYMSGDHAQKLQAYFAQTYPALQVSMGSDIWNVITSGGGGDDCIAVICGTGFVIYANKKEELKRVGGWGYLLDNKGSGCDLGRDCLRVALAQYDGFGPKTMLYDMVEEKLEGDIWKNISKIYAGGNSFIASFAPLVLEAYHRGDRQAALILEENTNRIAELVNYTAKAYECGPEVIISGGLLDHDSTMTDMVASKLLPRLRIIKPSLPQIYGACARSCKLFGEMRDGFRERFEENYQRYYTI